MTGSPDSEGADRAARGVFGGRTSTLESARDTYATDVLTESAPQSVLIAARVRSRFRCKSVACTPAYASRSVGAADYPGDVSWIATAVRVGVDFKRINAATHIDAAHLRSRNVTTKKPGVSAGLFFHQN